MIRQDLVTRRDRDIVKTGTIQLPSSIQSFMQTLKISKVGDSLSIVLSPEILQKLQVGEGDSIMAIETVDGIKLIADDLKFQAGIEAYNKVVNKYSKALEELAK